MPARHGSKWQRSARQRSASFSPQISLPTVLDFAGNQTLTADQLTRVFGERRTEWLDLRDIRAGAGRILRLGQDRIKRRNAVRMLLARVGL
jgi:hypothetical protein